MSVYEYNDMKFPSFTLHTQSDEKQATLKFYYFDIAASDLKKR